MRKKCGVNAAENNLLRERALFYFFIEILLETFYLKHNKKI